MILTCVCLAICVGPVGPATCGHFDGFACLRRPACLSSGYASAARLDCASGYVASPSAWDSGPERPWLPFRRSDRRPCASSRSQLHRGWWIRRSRSRGHCAGGTGRWGTPRSWSRRSSWRSRWCAPWWRCGWCVRCGCVRDAALGTSHACGGSRWSESESDCGRGIVWCGPSTLSGGPTIRGACLHSVPSSNGVRVTWGAPFLPFPLSRVFWRRFGFWNATDDVYDGHRRCWTKRKRSWNWKSDLLILTAWANFCYLLLDEELDELEELELSLELDDPERFRSLRATFSSFSFAFSTILNYRFSARITEYCGLTWVRLYEANCLFTVLMLLSLQ